MTTNAKALVAQAERRREFCIAADLSSWAEIAPAAVELASRLGVTLVVVSTGFEDVLGLTNAFRHKDALKAAGFFWSGAYKTWFAPTNEVFSAVSA